jgi:5'-3' exonuclease
MGISGFWQFLAKDCASTYDLVEGKGRDFNGDLPKIDHIFFDVNNLLYQITVTDISHFFKRLHYILDEILTLFPPTKTVYFGVDGPGMFGFSTSSSFFPFL